MAVLSEFDVPWAGERAGVGSAVAILMERVLAALRELGPYAVIGLTLPGGSVLALLLWLYRRHRRLP